MKNIVIALVLGILSSCLSYIFMTFQISMRLIYAFNPFVILYYLFDRTPASQFLAAIVVGAINLIPFLFFGILSIFMHKWKFGPWLFGALIALYVGRIVYRLI